VAASRGEDRTLSAILPAHIRRCRCGRLYWDPPPQHDPGRGGTPMITTDAPAWLRRSDQAVTWARTMLLRDRAVVIDCETTDLPGGVTGNDGYQNLRNSTRTRLLRWRKTARQRKLSAPNRTVRPKTVSRLMQDSCIWGANAGERQRSNYLQRIYRGRQGRIDPRRAN